MRQKNLLHGTEQAGDPCEGPRKIENTLFQKKIKIRQNAITQPLFGAYPCVHAFHVTLKYVYQISRRLGLLHLS